EQEKRLIAGDVFANELIESWKERSIEDLSGTGRFSPDEIAHDFPQVSLNSPSRIKEDVVLEGLSDSELETLSRERLWALSLAEMTAIRDHFRTLGRNPTDAEVEVLAQT